MYKRIHVYFGTYRPVCVTTGKDIKELVVRIDESGKTLDELFAPTFTNKAELKALFEGMWDELSATKQEKILKDFAVEVKLAKEALF